MSGPDDKQQRQMQKQLVFYVNKIMNRAGDIFIRIKPNQTGKRVWFPWNDQAHIPSHLISNKEVHDLVHDLLQSFNEYEDFKIIFNQEVFSHGGNPYFKKGENKKWLDRHLKLLPEDIAYIDAELFLNVIDKA